MPKHTLPANTAALAFDLAVDASTLPEGCNVQVFPDGAFCSDDGRPASLTNGGLKNWQMNAAVAQRLIAALNKSGKPILYDYDHESIFGKTRASGWLDKFVYVAGSGLFGHVTWTPAAAQAVADKEYRYSSPFFRFDAVSGEVAQLHSIALTNDPALDELSAVELARRAALARAASEVPNQPEQNTMPPKDDTSDALATQLAALKTERDTLNTQLVALTKERDEMKARLDAADAERAAAALAADNAKRDALVEAALADGTLPPAQKAWAEKQPLAALSEFLDAAKPAAALNRQSSGHAAPATPTLSESERAMCSRLGVSEEDFIKARLAETSAAAAQ